MSYLPSFTAHSWTDRSPIQAIVVRTFSTVYGLAGVRVRYADATLEIAARLQRFATKNNVNIVAALGARAALRDCAALEQAIKRNNDDRQEFFNQAISRMNKPIDSHANFVMINTHRPAATAVEHLRRDGVLVGGPYRNFETYIRVFVGKPPEMRRFWRVWDKLMSDHMRM